MVRCMYEFKSNRGIFKCPLETEEGNEYCYWHQEVEKKTPTEEQLNVLKEDIILGVFLPKVNFNFFNSGSAEAQREVPFLGGRSSTGGG